MVMTKLRTWALADITADRNTTKYMHTHLYNVAMEIS